MDLEKLPPTRTEAEAMKRAQASYDPAPFNALVSQFRDIMRQAGNPGITSLRRGLKRERFWRGGLDRPQASLYVYPDADKWAMRVSVRAPYPSPTYDYVVREDRISVSTEGLAISPLTGPCAVRRPFIPGTVYFDQQRNGETLKLLRETLNAILLRNRLPLLS